MATVTASAPRSRSRAWSRAWRRWGKTALGVLLVGLYLFPVYWMVATSVKQAGDVLAVPPQLIPVPPVLESYAEQVLGNPSLHRALVNSLVISLGTMVLTLLLAAPAAYALARLRLRIAGVVVLVLLMSQLLPSINVAVPLFGIFRQLGLINSYPALILANTIFTVPFAVIVLRPFFAQVPADLEDAAMVDGASRRVALARVVVPLVRPGLITVGVLSFLMAWGEFTFGLTLTTSETMQPVTVALNRFIGQYGTKWNDLMAVSTVIALPVVAVFVGLQRYVISGLTAGATKE